MFLLIVFCNFVITFRHFIIPCFNYQSFHVSPFPIPQVQPVEWPFSDASSTSGTSGARMGGKGQDIHSQSIADYLSKQKIDMVINLPLRQHRQSAIITKGYLTRRMAVDYSVPLITDHKCAKLMIKVCVCVCVCMCMYCQHKMGCIMSLA